MNDTIYRRDAIQALVDTEEIKGFAYKVLEDRLIGLPSANKWIPCSERLPDEDGEYLVTQKNGSIGRYVFNYDGNSEEYFKRCATAWMPLPKPWKGADDDSNNE